MRIHIRGNQFILGDVIKPYFFRTSFCLLGHYQAGRRDLAQAWIKRNKELGFDGLRVPGENEDWFDPGPPPPAGEGDNGFYGTTATPKAVALGPNAPGNSDLKLIPGYEKWVLQLAEDLASVSMVAEFICIFTVKGRDPEVVSHALNAFPQLFARLFPDPQNCPFLFEAFNEWNAHTVFDPKEVFRIGDRFRRSGEDRNYPGSTIGVSAGGSWSCGTVDWNGPTDVDARYTHRNLHPPRGSNWTDLGPLPAAKAKDRPTALNETVHYMTPTEWAYWVDSGRIEKWAGLSTKDHLRLVQYYKDVLASGVSVTAHDLIGQMTDPTQPLSPLELAIKEWRRPGPPPPPPKRYRYQPIIDRAYQEILGRSPDQGGLEYYDGHIAQGMTEATFRETLMRSPEYNTKNPQNGS